MSKHSSRDGTWVKKSVFICEKLDEDGSGTDFETSKSKTDTPTLWLNTYYHPLSLTSGLIKRIHYRLNPTNAETYTLRIWSTAVAADYESNMNMLYESPSAQADDEDYDRCELDIPLKLVYPAKIWFSLEWTGAPGTTSGFIVVSGEVVE